MMTEEQRRGWGSWVSAEGHPKEPACPSFSSLQFLKLQSMSFTVINTLVMTYLFSRVQGLVDLSCFP